MNTIVKEDEIAEELVKELLADQKTIMLYNDPVNTFEHVISCLMKYCDHNPNQAEQCTLIVHFNGKCSIKNGSMEKLKPIYEALLENQLTVKIE